jgi:hypothetical protein
MKQEMHLIFSMHGLFACIIGDFGVQLKYQAQIDEVVDCPPEHASPQSCDAFRFVHSNLQHENNSTPTALIDPSIYPPNSNLHCDSWTLSFFTTQEAAVKKFNASLRARPRLRERIGDHLAQGRIEEKDGLCTPTSRHGHFSLHESVAFDFHSVFSMIGPIPGAVDQGQ